MGWKKSMQSPHSQWSQCIEGKATFPQNARLYDKYNHITGDTVGGGYRIERTILVLGPDVCKCQGLQWLVRILVARAWCPGNGSDILQFSCYLTEWLATFDSLDFFLSHLLTSRIFRDLTKESRWNGNKNKLLTVSNKHAERSHG